MAAATRSRKVRPISSAFSNTSCAACRPGGPAWRRGQAARVAALERMSTLSSSPGAARSRPRRCGRARSARCAANRRRRRRPRRRRRASPPARRPSTGDGETFARDDIRRQAVGHHQTVLLLVNFQELDGNGLTHEVLAVGHAHGDVRLRTNLRRCSTSTSKPPRSPEAASSPGFAGLLLAAAVPSRFELLRVKCTWCGEEHEARWVRETRYRSVNAVEGAKTTRARSDGGETNRRTQEGKSSVSLARTRVLRV